MIKPFLILIFKFKVLTVMDPSLSIEGKASNKSSIYLKIRRRTLDHKALIPINLKIERRSTVHIRIQKPFDDAYNNSPRTRISKMRAARQTPERKVLNHRTFTSETPSSICTSSRKFTIDSKSSLRKEMLLRVSNLCEQERANTHTLLVKISNIRKTLVQTPTVANRDNQSLNGLFDTKSALQDFFLRPLERKHTCKINQLKENLFSLPN